LDSSSALRVPSAAPIASAIVLNSSRMPAIKAGMFSTGRGDAGPRPASSVSAAALALSTSAVQVAMSAGLGSGLESVPVAVELLVRAGRCGSLRFLGAKVAR
jgi:hypothetical protein